MICSLKAREPAGLMCKDRKRWMSQLEQTASSPFLHILVLVKLTHEINYHIPPYFHHHHQIPISCILSGFVHSCILVLFFRIQSVAGATHAEGTVMSKTFPPSRKLRASGDDRQTGVTIRVDTQRVIFPHLFGGW